MKKIVITLLFIFLALLVNAQNGSISGRVTDSTLKKPFALATITVFKAIDTSIVTYRLSSEKGEFKVTGLPLNVPLRFIVSFSGHSVYRKEFTLTEANNQLHFDNVVLVPVSNELEEVLIVAERPPVMIRKDTIEFNASSFKTLPNALVEDLLRKLPGVLVDGEGDITVNGKPVNKILVDGKAFFGDDPKMASRNLPSNIIDKVQVVDDKEQQLISGTTNPNDIGKVINLTFKKGVKKGWFGKAYAGGGTENLYEAGAIANIFRDTLQMSLLGYMNNINKAGFSMQDLLSAGGIGRMRDVGAFTSTSINNGGQGSSVSLNGVNFGGSASGGITKSKGAGININHSPNAKRSFLFQYFYGNTILDRRSETGMTQYFNDTVLNNLSTQLTKNVNDAHNIGAGFKLKPDSVTSIIMNINYTLGLGDEERTSMVMTANNKVGDLTQSNILQDNESTSQSYRHNFNFVRLSKKKKGRRLSITQMLDINNRIGDYQTESNTDLFYPSPSSRQLTQLRHERVPRTDARLFMNYNEPLGARWSLRYAVQVEYGKNKNDVNTYGKSATQKFDSLFDNLSSLLKRETGRVLNSVSAEYRYKDWRFSPGIRSLWQGSEVNALFLSNSFRQSGHNILPFFSTGYKQINLSYDEGVVLPGYQYLIAVPNNSDPYFITKNNPNLLPVKRRNLSLDWFHYNQRKLLNVFLVAQGSLAENEIVDAITVDNNGVQTTTPVNANGSRRFSINYNVSKQYKYNQKFSLTANIGGNHIYNHSLLYFNGISSWQSTYTVSNWGGIYMNWHDKFEWNSSFSTTNNFTSYSSKLFPRLNLFNYDLNTELILRYPRHVIWETRATWTKYASPAPGFPKNVIRWNAGVNFTMLKEEKGVLNFRVFDILDQNNLVNTSASRNMTSITTTNVLPRYFMATFTYNIRTLGAPKKKVGGWLVN
jgi:hypothetical protein